MSSTQSNQQDESPRWEMLLNKYVSVWLWSILFGTTTGLLYSFLSFRYDKWGDLGAVLIIPAVGSLVLAIGAWLQLYRALTQFLIPRYVLNAPSDGSEKIFAYCLRRTFIYFVSAAALRAVASIMEIMLAATGGIR